MKNSTIWVCVVIVLLASIWLTHEYFPYGKRNPDRETKFIVADMDPIPGIFRDCIGWCAIIDAITHGITIEKSMDHFMELDPNYVMTEKVYYVSVSESVISVDNTGDINTGISDSGYIHYFAKVYDSEGGHTWRWFREKYAIQEPPGFFRLTSVGLGPEKKKLIGTFEFFSPDWRTSQFLWGFLTFAISAIICSASMCALCWIVGRIRKPITTAQCR